MRRQLVSPTSVVIALSAAEFRLLSAFVERPGRLLTREQLLDLTRASGTEVSDRSIDLAVSRLRQKLSVPGRFSHLIKTVRGEGYMPDKVKVALTVPTPKLVRYPAAPIAASANAAMAMKFVDYLQSSPAQAVLARYGFGKP